MLPSAASLTDSPSCVGGSCMSAPHPDLEAWSLLWLSTRQWTSWGQGQWRRRLWDDYYQEGRNEQTSFKSLTAWSRESGVYHQPLLERNMKVFLFLVLDPPLAPKWQTSRSFHVQSQGTQNWFKPTSQFPHHWSLQGYLDEFVYCFLVSLLAPFSESKCAWYTCFYFYECMKPILFYVHVF